MDVWLYTVIIVLLALLCMALFIFRMFCRPTQSESTSVPQPELVPWGTDVLLDSVSEAIRDYISISLGEDDEDGAQPGTSGQAEPRRPDDADDDGSTRMCSCMRLSTYSRRRQGNDDATVLQPLREENQEPAHDEDPRREQSTQMVESPSSDSEVQALGWIFGEPPLFGDPPPPYFSVAGDSGLCKADQLRPLTGEMQPAII
ncbi:hypothetical protein BaRGS_00037568 [Batillaria attramentaria]|uniref:Uncharacterized protein n=1 Tax=Batillaria attramentaria TaxID=370345 RepID=A0ABD0J8B8_9CAEN|nr:hypothetical protein BaRGS_018951 [Batillaria attramentaria]KAG5687604.1 hypothetical protein BaRGS_031395 [Batillaria attramentaria]